MSESKTLRFLFLLVACAFGVIFFATVAQHFGFTVPFVSDFFQLIGLSATAGTTRNIVADHIVPAWQASKTVSPDLVIPVSLGGQKGE